MPLGPGSRLGPYEVAAAIGAGGMGEVYRARDTKLNRDVALKILPPAFASDPDRLARFHREAQVLASLNHPHIGAIYGFEDSGETHALVLEFVDGPTLADRIAQGPIPLEEALAIATQIAEALEAAHEQGIIHRDLKPANIKLRPDGTVKVLDFGLAKLAEPVGSGQSAVGSAMSMSPTITSPTMMTGIGVILGTAAYMSPEQAKGRVADKRSDVWAFGCVLYEMLAGRRPFGGDDVTDTIAAIVKSEPDWAALPADAGSSIRRVMRRCLEKDARRRPRDIGDVRMEIEDALSSPATPPPVIVRTAPRAPWVATVAGVAIVASGLTWLVARQQTTDPPPEMRLDVATPTSPDPTSFAVSPDGQQIVYTAAPDGRWSLWLRSFDSADARPLAGTAGAVAPFWSPDSRSIGFFADNRLKRIDLQGGAPQILAEAPAPRGGTWSSTGVILFTGRANGVASIPASGGTATPLTGIGGTLIDGGRWPQFLPDGERFLFYVGFGPPEMRGTYLATLGSKDFMRVMPGDTAAIYAPSGYLIYFRSDAVVAQRFDAASGSVSGNAIPIVRAGVEVDAFRAALAAGGSDLIAYRTGVQRRRQLVWVDRSGAVKGTVGAEDESSLASPELSPDERIVAVQRNADRFNDVWLIDAARGVRTRFTFDFGFIPAWSHDGRYVAFGTANATTGEYLLLRKPPTGGDTDTLETIPATSLADPTVMALSPDDRYLLYAIQTEKAGVDLWAVPTVGERKAFPVAQSRFDEQEGQFSPDGKWVAYQSNESGRMEIYVQPFPAAGGKLQVSTASGTQPRWHADGQELFYIGPDGRMMAAAIAVCNQSLEPAAPVALFATRLAVGGNVFGGSRAKQQYAVARDGRFLLNTTVETATPPITIVLNWTAGLTN